jgi:folylpolyglutamate synthase/dihydropteroate synthase
MVVTKRQTLQQRWLLLKPSFGDQPLDIEAVRAGFAAVTSPGRCEVVHRETNGYFGCCT